MKSTQGLRAFFRSFTPYQMTYLGVVFLLTLLFTLLMPEMMLEDMSNPFVVACSVISVLANPICELLISKQSRLNFVVDFFLIEIPEFVLCIALGWYTIAIFTIIFWMPIDVISFLKWRRHRDEEQEELTIVKRLSVKQDIFIVIGILVFSALFGQLIGRIPGAEDTFLNSLATATGMVNGVLLLLRYSEQWYAWFITLILYTILYITSGSYIMLITVFAMLVNTCYGFGKWLLYTKKRQKRLEAK